LDEAINYYHKGFVIKNDYYNGENYANCMLLKTQQPNLSLDEKSNLKYNSKKIYEKIIEIIHSSLSNDEENIWMYATLAVSYLGIEDTENHSKYQKAFYDKCTVEWEKASYMETLTELKACIINQRGAFRNVKDSEAKKTSCLVPYDELLESEKEYDRNTAWKH